MAGVSQSTVSLVLSGKSRGRISARTEEAVRRAARELGYRPNIAARALRTGATRSVGLVVPDITHPFMGGVMRGAQTAAWAAGYTVALADIAHDPDWEQASVEALRAGPVDGFLFFEAQPPPNLGVPAVAIESERPGIPFVRLDTEGGTDAVLRHLLELGHTRIGHLASSIDEPTFQVREARRRAMLAAAGLDPDALPRTTAIFELDDAARAAGELIEAGASAVFCDDDVLACGVYLAARERGVRIPADISVVGFDDLYFARVLDPPLTTVAADPEELGAAAFRVLAAGMAGVPSPQSEVLDVRLVVRESTAPPASR